ncbi:MAG: EamA family transporter [Bryobacteraceae bacterium]
MIWLNALGNLSLAWGMKHAGESVSLNPLSFLRVMLDPAVAGGILLLILWLLSRMTLLSWADLSFVLPLTSLGYVLAAVFGRIFLKEVVTGAHWLGTGLIFLGTTIVGTTDSKTRDRGPSEQL